jgi:hypothetical protein
MPPQYSCNFAIKNQWIMKKFVSWIAVSILLLSVQIGTAQDTTHTLLKFSRPNYLGIYIAPEFQYGQLGGDFTTFGGGSAMLLLNKKWAIGATITRSMTRDFQPKDVAPYYLNAAFGGLRMEYTPKPNKAVHVSFPLVIGWGQARKDSVLERFDRFDDDDRFDRSDNNRTGYFTVQPSIQLEANLLRFAKIYAGANYRLNFTNNATPTVATSVLNGFSMNVGLKLGLFDLFVGKKQVSQ